MGAVSPERVVRVSKFLSKHLRHQPERIGLVVASGGWVDVAALLRACAKNGIAISRAELDEVVATNDKKRFSFDETGTRIRANQGHTIGVDLELAPSEPPDALFHGTAERSVPAILAAGLLKLSRHHVHLSIDVETARKVGARHGRPVVLTVAARTMRHAGYEFFLSANGVWLVDHVPPEFLHL
jgi:putative RNA 2'-phosphotransferase